MRQKFSPCCSNDCSLGHTAWGVSSSSGPTNNSKQTLTEHWLRVSIMPDIMEHYVWNAVITPHPYSFVIVSEFCGLVTSQVISSLDRLRVGIHKHGRMYKSRLTL